MRGRGWRVARGVEPRGGGSFVLTTRTPWDAPAVANAPTEAATKAGRARAATNKEIARWRRVHELLSSTEVPDDIVGFHAQQAVEKWLKSVIASRGEDFEYTHDLHRLLTLANQDQPLPRRGTGRVAGDSVVIGGAGHSSRCLPIVKAAPPHSQGGRRPRPSAERTRTSCLDLRHQIPPVSQSRDAFLNLWRRNPLDSRGLIVVDHFPQALPHPKRRLPGRRGNRFSASLSLGEAQ
jgi:hypothetical protein